MWFILAALAVSPAADDADAKAAFTKMEAVVLKAKTFQTRVEITAVAEKKPLLELKGRLAVAEGNKLRMDLDGTVRGEAGKMSLVSDGTKMRMSGTDSPGREQDADKQLTEIILASVSRTGVFHPLFFASEKSDADGKKEVFAIDKDLPVSGFKLGKKETVAGAEAIAVSYTVSTKGSKAPVAVTVWIDTKTNLPVKRVLVAKEGTESITMTETYTKNVLDGKLDPKEFMLPK